MSKNSSEPIAWRLAALALSGWFFLPATPLRAADEPAGPCQEPVFLQYEARIADKPGVAQRIRSWKEFLQLHPDHACREEVERRLRALEASTELAEESDKTESWKQEARGGLIEPGKTDFPSMQLTPDPVPRYRARLQSEIVPLTEEAQFRMDMEGWLWTQILRLEAAPVYNLSVSVDLPFLAGEGSREEDAFGYAVGNIVLGVRGTWGGYLKEDSLPLVVSGGVLWGTGSSAWSSSRRTRVLDAAAFAAPYHYHFFKSEQTTYAIHAEAQLGAGRHFVAASVAYYIVDQGKPLDFRVPPDPALGIFRFDLAYQVEILPWLFPSMEFGGGFVRPGTTHLHHLHLSPGAHLRWGHLFGGVAVRIPLLDVREFNRIVIAFEVGGQI